MAGPETPFPWMIRYVDRLWRLPPEQRAHVIAQAKARIKAKRAHGRDRAFAKLGD